MANAVISQDIQRIVASLKKEARELEGNTVLIAGGSGFIGSYFVATLYQLNQRVFQKPCRVISIDNYITGKKRSVFKERRDPHFTFLKHDIVQPLEIKGKIDYIIHAAGLASPVYYKKFPVETIESAIFGAKNLLELGRKKKAKSFLFFSSSEIYGDPDPNFIPTPETYRGNVSCTGPRACYDESKRLGETLCLVYHELYHIPVKIVRPFNVYGPGMRPDDYRVIPMFLTSALKRNPLPVHDAGNQTRTFCYISDAVIGFFKVLLSRNNGQVYNVGSDDDEINIISLAKIVAELFKNKISVKNISYPKKYPGGEPKRRCPDLTKIKKELGYRPKIDLRRGLKRTLRWYHQELKLNRIKSKLFNY